MPPSASRPHPTGCRYASYGQRVGAFLLDRILLLLLVTVCSIPWIGQLVSWYTGLISDVVNDPNATIPTDTEIMQQITPYLIPITIVGIVVSLLYNTIFLTRVRCDPRHVGRRPTRPAARPARKAEPGHGLDSDR